MSLVREERLYKAYCDLCFYIGKTPLRRSKWRNKNSTPTKHNKTVEDIKRELDEIREYA